VADDSRSRREQVGVGPVVAGGVLVDHGGAGVVDGGVVDGERVADRLVGAGGKRPVGKDRQGPVVAVRNPAFLGPQAPGVPYDVVDERRGPDGVREAELPPPGGPVALEDLEVVGHGHRSGGGGELSCPSGPGETGPRRPGIATAPRGRLRDRYG